MRKFSSYIRKLRMEQLQSHIRLTASSYMVKYLRISSYIRKPFLIHNFATAPRWISLYMRKILFSSLSLRHLSVNCNFANVGVLAVAVDPVDVEFLIAVGVSMISALFWCPCCSGCADARARSLLLLASHLCCVPDFAGVLPLLVCSYSFILLHGIPAVVNISAYSI